jgi:uncharacterized membrane protein YqaE (UPF0057 family)
MKKVLFLLCGAFLMASCQSVDIVKRKYTGGYYVNLRNNQQHSDNNSKVELVTNTAMTGIAHQQIQPSHLAPVALATTSVTTINQQSESARTTKTIVADKENPTTTANNIADKHVVLAPKPTPPADGGTDINQVVMIILALLIPPLAIWLKEGITQRFWIDLICYLLGFGFFFSPFAYGGALALFAVVFAVLIVLDMI